MIRYDKQNRLVEKLKRELEDCRDASAKLIKESAKIREVLSSTLHEVRRFNSEISANSDLLRKIQAKRSCDKDEVEVTDTIFYTSGMLSARMAFTDFELNPTQANRQAKYRSGIYRKFEKAKYVLAQAAKAKRIQLILKGNSYLELDMLPAFELVPFIILDNAIKYSPQNQQVLVEFNENPNLRRLSVTVTSLGPVIDVDELDVIFSRGERGRHASRFDGEGLGLYLCKRLCDWHEVALTATSDSSKRFDIEGIPYSDVTFQMEFKS